MNAHDHKLPPEFHFPKPPFQVDENLSEVTEAAAGYIAAILLWRRRVLAFLSTVSGKGLLEAHQLSRSAQDLLATFLAGSWGPEISRYAPGSPYNLRAFPLDLLEGKNNSDAVSVLEALRWRGGIVDYLADAPFAWQPSVDLEEAVAIQRFLTPVDRTNLCALCLTELVPQQVQSGWHKCVLTSHVRAKWPTPPAAFRRWGRPV